MIEFRNVHKWYGAIHALDGACLRVEPGQLCLLCGPSGGGKSTLLGTVNGLEPIQKGEIIVDGVRVDRYANLGALRQKIGVVFQGFSLFGHMTIERNVRLALEKVLHLSPGEAERRACAQLERLGLLHKRRAYPAELSGGQQQRAAIARCLAMDTKILLLDEPTSALDIENSQEVVSTIRSLLGQGITIMLATHQLQVFVDVADSYACLEGGRVVESGPMDLVRDGQNDVGSRFLTWLAKHSDLRSWSPPRIAPGPEEPGRDAIGLART
jgi:ABC-type polar amino acid transport system ATPase subunit